jgi:hypothetical protein
VKDATEGRVTKRRQRETTEAAGTAYVELCAAQKYNRMVMWLRKYQRSPGSISTLARVLRRESQEAGEL